MSKGLTSHLGRDIFTLSNQKCTKIDFLEEFPCIELGCISKVTGEILDTKDISETTGTRNLFSSGQVLFGKLRPNLKKFCRPNFDGACSAEIWVIDSRNEKILLQDYLFYFIQSNEFMIAACTTAGTKMPRASWKIIQATDFILPPIQEQRQIVEILNDADVAITTSRKKQKSIEMRNKILLKRLTAGDSKKKWEKKSLDEFLVVKKGDQINRTHLFSTGEYPVYSGGIGPSGYFDKWNTEAGTLTISEGGNSCGYVRYVNRRFWSGGHCYTLTMKDDNLDSKLVYFLLKARELKIMRLRAGSGLPNIQLSNLLAMRIYLPPAGARRGIFKALTLAELEHEQLVESISNLKKLKQGLMQQLLTGKRRIVAKKRSGK